MATANTNQSSQRLSREEYKRLKELDELRKTGAAPPELDEDGNMINPHIPQFISQQPWYLTPADAAEQKPGLKHQRATHFNRPKLSDNLEVWYKRGKAATTAQPTQQQGKPLKFQAGACENCGATTHKTVDCLERPRAKNAKKLGKRLAGDDVVTDIDLSFEAKRDRWGGYDPREYSRVVQQHEKLEQERKRKKMQELEEEFKTIASQAVTGSAADQTEERKSDEPADAVKVSAGDDARKLAKLKKMKKLAKLAKAKLGVASTTNGDQQSASADNDHESDASDTDSDSDIEGGDSDDDLRDYGETMQQRDEKTNHTVRNLRIREDTAKYLYNLNTNSAYYDPKTRSMRDNPLIGKTNANPNILAQFAGDNFVKQTGETKKIQELQQFAWDAAEKHGNTDVHAQAIPSAVETMYNSYTEKKAELTRQKQLEIQRAYVGEQEQQQRPPTLIGAESSSYEEYDADGQLIHRDQHGNIITDRSANHNTLPLVTSSRYPEDVYEAGHTSVYGSFYDLTTGEWGYSCCWQTVRRAYCTGSAGKEAKKEMLEQMERRTQQLDEKQKAAAIAKEHAAANGLPDPTAPVSRQPVVDPAVAEAYQRQKQRADDPMLAFKDTS